MLALSYHVFVTEWTTFCMHSIPWLSLSMSLYSYRSFALDGTLGETSPCPSLAGNA